MKTSYYEYGIELKYWEIRDKNPEIVCYNHGFRRYRDSYVACLNKLGQQNLIESRRKQMLKGAQVLLWRPKTHVRAYMFMSASGIIKEYDILPRFQYLWADVFKELVYGCMNRALELGWRYVKLRTPVLDYNFNIFMEDFMKELGCDLFVTVKNY